LKVFAEGTLNVEKALSVFEDLIELRTGEVIRGRIEGMNALTVDGSTFDWKTILKVSPDTAGNARVLVQNPGGIVVVRNGAVLLPELAIRPTGATVARSIRMRDIWDLVPAAPEYR
jgi:hypothetical protein